MLLSLPLAAAASVAMGATAAASPAKLGVMVDAGVPDGFNGSLIYRPLRPIDLHAGIGTNLISMGVRAGASLYLLPTRVSPSLNAEAGHYFAGDANAAAARLGLGSGSDEPLLRDFGYDYANLHLGLDLGRDHFSFYLHAGWSIVRGTLHHLDEAVQDEANGDSDQELTVEVGEGATVTVVAPSARIGFRFFF